MNRGLCGFLWQLAAILYLLANGAMGLQKTSGGIFWEILSRIGFRGDALDLLVIVLSAVALAAGIAVLLDLFSVELPFLNILVFIVTVVWVVYIVVALVSWWVTGGAGEFFRELAALAVNGMVLASLLSASKRFE
ncbi:MAG: hypothetical protein FWC64_11220 [Treponema sp.]|nr:hypothetical protein [Treponema sp.]